MSQGLYSQAVGMVWRIMLVGILEKMRCKGNLTCGGEERYDMKAFMTL